VWTLNPDEVVLTAQIRIAPAAASRIETEMPTFAPLLFEPQRLAAAFTVVSAWVAG